jgi:hypothetical protein
VAWSGLRKSSFQLSSASESVAIFGPATHFLNPEIENGILEYLK